MAITILLADDHRMIREGLRALLETEPGLAVVGEAADGDQAVRLAAELSPRVVVMDLSMPKLGGLDATRQIVTGNAGGDAGGDAGTDAGTKVVILSAHSEPRVVEQVLEAGASGYVLKEMAAEELPEAVRVVSAGGRYLSRGLRG